LIVTIQDKTELRAMEETLRRSDRLAAVGRMAAGLAHEIRNPLGSMSSALQFLSEKAKPDTEDAALMSVVLSESERLNGIITDFLEYARPPRENESNGDLRQTDVGHSVIDCLALLRHNPAVNELHEFDFVPPAKPVMIHAHEAQAKQIFWNLFQNSIQAMPNGGRLSVAINETDPGQVRITVSDTGKGISRDELGRIFEPFHSGANGTGLGLSIVHRIVTEHGGNIDVQSETGKGTMVTIELPELSKSG
jgi:two-component system sensor histidine kinase PilS (NtrC family)